MGKEFTRGATNTSGESTSWNELVGAFPEPSVVAVTFDPLQRVMYATSLSGFTTWDISDPTLPVPLGKLQSELGPVTVAVGTTVLRGEVDDVTRWRAALEVPVAAVTTGARLVVALTSGEVAG